MKRKPKAHEESKEWKMILLLERFQMKDLTIYRSYKKQPKMSGESSGTRWLKEACLRLRSLLPMESSPSLAC